MPNIQFLHILKQFLQILKVETPQGDVSNKKNIETPQGDVSTLNQNKVDLIQRLYAMWKFRCNNCRYA